MIRIFCSALLLQLAGSSVFSLSAMAESETGKEVNVEAKRVWGKQTHGQAISIMTSNTSFAAQEPIILTITLKNVGTNDVQVMETGLLRDYVIEVVTSDLKDVPLTLYGQKLRDGVRSGGVNIRTATYKPGEGYSIEVELTRLFDFTLGGSYGIMVRGLILDKADLNARIEATSNPLIITVRGYTTEDARYLR
jgi:hypothetical protein